MASINDWEVDRSRRGDARWVRFDCEIDLARVLYTRECSLQRAIVTLSALTDQLRCKSIVASRA